MNAVRICEQLKPNDNNGKRILQPFTVPGAGNVPVNGIIFVSGSVFSRQNSVPLSVSVSVDQKPLSDMGVFGNSISFHHALVSIARNIALIPGNHTFEVDGNGSTEMDANDFFDATFTY
jgi:hypothetical protein